MNPTSQGRSDSTEQSNKGIGHVSQRSMNVEIENGETGEVRPARLTHTGILFDEVGTFSNEWFVINPIDRNLEQRI